MRLTHPDDLTLAAPRAPQDPGAQAPPATPIITAPSDTQSPAPCRRRSSGGAPATGAATRRRNAVWWTSGLTVALLTSALIAVAVGPASVSPTTAARIIAHHLLPDLVATPADARGETIVWTLRAPRVLLAVTVGAGLALTGVIMQSLIRNVLADPYVLGVNSGASLGAAAAILFGAGAGLGDYALQGSAFLGALLATGAVLAVARAGGQMIPVRLLMAGVTVGYALSAATSFLIFASDSAEGSRSVMFWLLGSLGLAAWNGPLAVAVAVVAGAVALALIVGPRLDVLDLGDDTALSLGVNPDRMRVVLLTGCCLVVGVLVAMAGSIGFIGLVAPHIARRLIGTTHRRLIPVAVLLGALLLVWADLASRTLLAPQEIPIGVITALLGAPLLLVLVRRFQHL